MSEVNIIEKDINSLFGETVEDLLFTEIYKNKLTILIEDFNQIKIGCYGGHKNYFIIPCELLKDVDIKIYEIEERVLTDKIKEVRKRKAGMKLNLFVSTTSFSKAFNTAKANASIQNLKKGVVSSFEIEIERVNKDRLEINILSYNGEEQQQQEEEFNIENEKNKEEFYKKNGRQ